LASIEHSVAKGCYLDFRNKRLADDRLQEPRSELVDGGKSVNNQRILESDAELRRGAIARADIG
jgi:hypothetical protein